MNEARCEDAADALVAALKPFDAHTALITCMAFIAESLRQNEGTMEDLVKLAVLVWQFGETREGVRVKGTCGYAN